MIALDSIEIVDKDLINVIWFENGNHWQTWDSNDLFNHIIELNDEIERLNNIINELKEWFKGYHKSYASCKWYEEDYIEFIEHLENELKGSEKE